MPRQPTPQKAFEQKNSIATPQSKLELHAAQIPNFDDLPDTAWIRQSQLVRDPKYPTHPDEFLQQFKATRAETVARTLDASPVASAVLEFIEANPYGIEASVKDILTRLEHYKPAGAEAWPRTPKGLGDALRRASPALRQLGVECKSLGNIGGKVKWVIKGKLPTPFHVSHEVIAPSDAGHDIKTSMTSSPAGTLATEVL